LGQAVSDGVGQGEVFARSGVFAELDDQAHHLIEHLAMLADRTDNGSDSIGVNPKILNHWCHFYCFRTRSENTEYGNQR